MPQDPFSLLRDVHDAARAQYDKLSSSRTQLSAAKSELDALLRLGDTVDPDDVVKSAAKLVGHGIEPRALATLLSSMPVAGGEPLRAWLTQHDSFVVQEMRRLAPLHEQARHALADSSLRLLLADHLHRLGLMPGHGLEGPRTPTNSVGGSLAPTEQIVESSPVIANQLTAAQGLTPAAGLTASTPTQGMA